MTEVSGYEADTVRKISNGMTDPKSDKACKMFISLKQVTARITEPARITVRCIDLVKNKQLTERLIKMKIHKITAGIAAVMLLTACNSATGSDISDTVPETVSISDAADETTSAATTASITTTAAAAAETEAAEDTTVTEETTVSEESSEIVTSALPENFDLREYVAEKFEQADPASYEVIEMSDASGIDSEAISAASAAIKNSGFYAAVIDEAKELLVYENGTHSAVEESFLIDDYLRFFNGEGSSKFAFEPLPVYGAKAEFDGENTGSVIIFEMPLAFDFLEWSGTGTFYVSAYVNSKGEAFILNNACNQTMHDPVIMKYSDNKCHFCFQMGHTDGTSRIAIYSFDDETPAAAAELYGNMEFSPDNVTFRTCNYVGYGDIFFRDKIKNSYFALKCADISPELKEYLFSAPDVLEKFPEIKNDSDARINVYGGKFIAINGMGFEVKNGEIKSTEKRFYQSDPSELPCINADLSGF